MARQLTSLLVVGAVVLTLTAASPSPAQSPSPTPGKITSMTRLQMARQLTSLLVVGAVVLTLTAASPSPAQSPRSYTECSSSADCGQGRCCVIVNGRYPTTACMQRPMSGQQCRPHGATSATLQFPGGASVHVTDVYKNLCPCEGATVCNSSGTCSR